VRLLDEDRLEKRAVAVISPTLTDTRRAFDSVAPDYEQSNAANPILCWMRRQTLAAVTSRVPRGGRLLDLGCGPGADEESLALAGYQVRAIDWSPAMVDETSKRIARLGLEHLVNVHHLGIHEIDRLPPGTFDAACSNFGPLNCVPDLPRAAALIGERIRPGGILVASVIGRVCPWELALFAWRRDWRRLAVRFARTEVAVPLNGGKVWTRYYAPSEFERPFLAAGFERLSLRTLGLFVPPPYMDALAARRPSLVAALQRVEERVGDWPGLRSCGDHFLVVMQKRSKS
jgi:SAM-dependent methyltransferase